MGWECGGGVDFRLLWLKDEERQLQGSRLSGAAGVKDSQDNDDYKSGIWIWESC